MPIQLIDHTFAPWLAKKRQENGAATYSEDLCRFFIPHIIKMITEQYPYHRVLISTAPPLWEEHPASFHHRNPDLVIQYLHTYPYTEPLRIARELELKFPESRIIVITAYHAYAALLNQYFTDKPHRAVYLPMFVDTGQFSHLICPVGVPKTTLEPADRRIIYFGNLYKAKAQHYRELRSVLDQSGWKVDLISHSRFNRTGPVLSRPQIWEKISQYRFGIGVGRCALEMYTMGLQVLISGQNWGGIILTDEDIAVQRRSNFNGRVITGTRDIREALSLLPHSIRSWYHPGDHHVRHHVQDLIQAIETPNSVALFYK